MDILQNSICPLTNIGIFKILIKFLFIPPMKISNGEVSWLPFLKSKLFLISVTLRNSLKSMGMSVFQLRKKKSEPPGAGTRKEGGGRGWRVVSEWAMGKLYWMLQFSATFICEYEGCFLI